MSEEMEDERIGLEKSLQSLMLKVCEYYFYLKMKRAQSKGK